MTSGGESNEELLDEEAGDASIGCDELTPGTATAGEGGGIEGAFAEGANSPGDGVLDRDLERDLDRDLVSSTILLTPLTTT
jgi:hypothetical protein